jgi:hypothetical protein
MLLLSCIFTFHAERMSLWGNFNHGAGWMHQVTGPRILFIKKGSAGQMALNNTQHYLASVSQTLIKYPVLCNTLKFVQGKHPHKDNPDFGTSHTRL